MKGPSSGSIERILSVLPVAQRRVAKALIAGPEAKTYSDVAAELGVHLGTVYQHLRRIRIGNPGAYSVVMVVRGQQLAEQNLERWVLAKAKDGFNYGSPCGRSPHLYPTPGRSCARTAL